MTPQQIILVQHTFSLAAPNSEAVATAFYDNLFEMAPGVRELFADDLSDQRRKLMKMLAAAISGLNDVEEIVPVLQDLGVRHIDYGASEEAYEVVGQALIKTLADSFGPAFTDEVEEAWLACYGLVSSTMIAAHKAHLCA